MKLLRKVFLILAYLMPAVLFFSYYPLISLGKNHTMNFELSLPLIWLVLFDIIAFIILIHLYLQKRSAPPRPTSRTHPQKRARRNAWGPDFKGISDKRFFLFSLFPFYATISAFWSLNPTRAILTAGVLWLTFFAVFALLFVFPLLKPSVRWRKYFLKSLFISTAVVCGFCWLQCLLDLAGLSRQATLLCAGCTFWTFGFPHPSGFAIEPQFMGNLLLAPTLLALYLLAFRRRYLSRKHLGMLILAATLFSATLFLTLSRGAIYAYAVALLILFIFTLVRRAKWQYLIIIPVATFCLTLTAQGIFSAISPTPDTFYSGVAKVVHQMSLGLIDIRPTTPSSPSSSSSSSNPDPSATTGASTSESLPPVEDDNSSIFDGYIPASTNVRLGLTSLAVQTWLRSGPGVLFGVGLGGAGLALSGAFPDHELALPNAIVQNEFFSLLLELGLVGILLVLFSLCLAFFAPLFSRRFLDGRSASNKPNNTPAAKPATPAAKPAALATKPAALATKPGPSLKLRQSVFWSHPALPLLLALIAAYLVTLNFFSGLPNALQIYLMPPLLFLIFAKDPHHLVDD